MKQTVCHLIRSLESGGAENHLKVLAMCQHTYGLTVHIISLLPADAKFCESLEEKVRVHDLGRYSYFKKVLLIRNILISNEVDVLHSHLPLAEILGVISTRRLRVVKIVSRHVTGKYSQRWHRNYLKPLSKLIIHKYNKAIAISEAVKKSLMSIEKLPPSKIEVIHYGYEQQTKPTITTNVIDNSNNHETFRIVSIMRLENQKRPLDAIALFKLFNNVVPKSELYIFGDGALRSDCEALILQENMCNKIKLMGRVANIGQNLSQFDLFVHTSAYEGFGLVYLESIANGIPILTSANDAAKEILQGTSSMLFPIGDIQAALSQLLHIYNNYKSIKTSFVSESMRVLTKFSASEMLRKTIMVYTKETSVNIRN